MTSAFWEMVRLSIHMRARQRRVPRCRSVSEPCIGRKLDAKGLGKISHAMASRLKAGKTSRSNAKMWSSLHFCRDGDVSTSTKAEPSLKSLKMNGESRMIAVF